MHQCHILGPLVEDQGAINFSRATPAPIFSARFMLSDPGFPRRA